MNKEEEMKKKYYVSFQQVSCGMIKIEAASKKEATEKAWDQVGSIFFGDPETEIIAVEEVE
jgi:hypothetical protein